MSTTIAVDWNGIQGDVLPGFEVVVEAFRTNFESFGEVGAAFAATHNGEVVVDIWGGAKSALSGEPWKRDTLQLIFSGSKGVVAICLALLIDRGMLDLSDKVAKHWPEFASAGKSGLTVADVASHRARMPCVRSTVDETTFLDGRAMADLLAKQSPETDPRTEVSYHALTFGWLCAEIVRRVDGRPIGQFVAEELAQGLGLELWLGLPSRFESRVSTLQYSSEWIEDPYLSGVTFGGDGLWSAIWRNPEIFPANEVLWNRASWHAAEIPAANVIATARSIARLYAALLPGNSPSIISKKTFERTTTLLAEGVDPFTGELLAYSAGFELQTADSPFGPPDVAFGHTGAGGSVHGAWPAHGVTFSYAMNNMRAHPDGDPRARTLLAALHSCVADMGRGNRT
ncbi:CubicO group peptidase (beta-lactamase class C family) [Marmoricola sp. URHA0025 HA25]